MTHQTHPRRADRGLLAAWFARALLAGRDYEFSRLALSDDPRLAARLRLQVDAALDGLRADLTVFLSGLSAGEGGPDGPGDRPAGGDWAARMAALARSSARLAGLLERYACALGRDPDDVLAELSLAVWTARCRLPAAPAPLPAATAAPPNGRARQ